MSGAVRLFVRVLLAASLLGGSACDATGTTAPTESVRPKASPTQRAVATAKPLPKAPAEPAPSDAIVTEADFEEEADAQIDASNMDAELTALTNEIRADE